MTVPYAHIPQRPRDLLDEVYSHDGAETWWNVPCHLLRSPQGIKQRPAQLWADGEQDVVVQALQRLCEGML